MSGHVTIPRAEVEAMRDQLGKAARKLEGGRLGDIVQTTADILDDALAGEYEDAGDPAANDTRPDPELLAALREAVRVQGLTVHATLYGPANATATGRHVLEVEPLLPVLSIPAHGSSVTLTSGARGRVMFPPHHEGNAVTIKLELMSKKPTGDQALPTPKAN